MAASILAPFQPTGQPFAKGPRGLFVLSWAQRSQWGGDVKELGPRGAVDPSHDKVCVVHCQLRNFESTFHSRRSRFHGHWVGAIKGWVFPAEHAQKVANLVDQVSAYLASKGESLAPKPSAPPAAGPSSVETLAAAERDRQNARLDESLLARSMEKPWTYSKGSLEAKFLKEHIFFGGPAIRFKFDYDPNTIRVVKKIPGAAWDAQAKHWLVPGRSIRVARKLLAAIERGPRWHVEEGRRQRAAIPRIDCSIPDIFARSLQAFCWDDSAQRVVWTSGILGSGYSRLESLTGFVFDRVGDLDDGSDSTANPIGDAGDGMPKYLRLTEPRDRKISAPQNAVAAQQSTFVRAGRPKPTAAKPLWILSACPDWKRAKLAASLRVLRVLGEHIEREAVGVRLRANQTKPSPDGVPAIRGQKLRAGEVFLSQGRFWMLAKDGDQTKDISCWALGEPMARQWLYPTPVKKISSLADLASLSDADTLRWMTDLMREHFSLNFKSLAEARERCEKLSGGPLHMLMSEFERANLQKEVQAVEREQLLSEPPETISGPSGSQMDSTAKPQRPAAKRKAKRL